MKLKAAVVGTGDIAKAFHIPTYKKLEDVELVAVCDLNKERAEEVAKQFEVENAYTDYGEMLEKHRPDIVDVCTPNYAHCGPSVAALASGAHVMCEKPMAMNVEECERMIAASKKSGRLLTIAFHFRFMRDMEHLKWMIDDGALGDIYYARGIVLRRSGIPGWGVFHRKDKSGGGPFIDIGVHVLDLLLWLMGSPKPTAVSGCAFQKFGRREDVIGTHWPADHKRDEYDVEDFAAAFVRLDNGACLAIEASWASHIEEAHQNTLMLLGEKSGASAHPVKIHTQMGGAHVDITPKFIDKGNPHAAEIEYFVQCVKGNQEVRVKPDEALEVQRIVNAVYESSEKGQEIRLR